MAQAKKKQTAEQAFEEKKAAIRALIKKLEGQIETFEVAFKGQAGLFRRDWGFVGSLGFVEEQLTEATDHLGGTAQ